MTKIKVTVPSTLQSKLNKMVLETKKELAKKTRDELVIATSNAMEIFYGHYTPRRYKRTHGFRDKSFVGLYKNPHNSRIYGGVRLTTENLDASNYHTYKLNSSSNKWERVDIDPSDAISGAKYPETMGDIRELVYSGHHGDTELFNEMYHGKRNFTIPPVMSPSPYELVIQRRDNYLNTKIKNKEYINKLAIKFWN